MQQRALLLAIPRHVFAQLIDDVQRRSGCKVEELELKRVQRCEQEQCPRHVESTSRQQKVETGNFAGVQSPGFVYAKLSS